MEPKVEDGWTLAEDGRRGSPIVMRYFSATHTLEWEFLPSRTGWWVKLVGHEDGRLVASLRPASPSTKRK